MPFTSSAPAHGRPPPITNYLSPALPIATFPALSPAIAPVCGRVGVRFRALRARPAAAPAGRTRHAMR